MPYLRQRLSRLLLVLLGTLDRADARQDLQPSELMTLLSGAGYQEQDLQDLWSWLQGRWSPSAEQPNWLSSRQAAKATPRALRLLGEREDDLLTVPAFGYLLELVRSRQITAEQMESIIQLTQLVPGGPLSAGDIAALLEQVMLAEQSSARALSPYRSERAH